MSCGHCDNSTSNQLLSRSVEVRNLAGAVRVLSYNDPHRAYRIFVEELTATSVIQLKLIFGYDATEETIVLYCNPLGAIEYFSTKPCIVEAVALTADSTISIGVEGDPCVISQRVTSSSTQAITNAAYTDLGDFGGTAPPYTNTVSLFPNGNVDIQIIDISVVPNQTIFTKLNLDEAADFLRFIQLGNRYKIQAKSVNPNGLIGTVWSNY